MRSDNSLACGRAKLSKVATDVIVQMDTPCQELVNYLKQIK